MKGTIIMEQALKDEALDAMWRALRIAAGDDDIPMKAQLEADKVSDLIDKIIALAPQDID